jgi:competence protein ComEA
LTHDDEEATAGLAALDRPPPPLTWRDRVEQLADATGSTPVRLVAGGAVVVAAVIGGLWAMRPPAAPAELSLPFASTTQVSQAPSADPTSGGVAVPQVEAAGPHTPAGEFEAEPEPDELVVHVAGAVNDAGVHRLLPGARVVDAVVAAGGLGPEADEARVNLAAPVVDGERVYVPRIDEDDPPQPVAGARPDGAAVGAPGPPGAAEVIVDINRASVPELESLPGVGPATAAAIVDHRSRVGAFTSVEQLIDVRGIGPAKLEQMRPLVRV